MLGISANTMYKTIDDFQTASDYLAYLYNDVNGYTAKCTKSRNDAFYTNFFSTSNIVTTAFSGVLDAYVSMNTFFFRGKTINREKRNLKRLNTCYVDIDCYKVNKTKENVLLELEADYFGSKIPYPTFVIDSGRGLYLIYKLRNEDRNAFPNWNSVQKYLVEQCLPLGADSSCTDASRILRVPFSVNSKSGTSVKILDFSDLTYSIHDIQTEYGIKKCVRKKNISISPKKKATGVVHPYGEATQKMRDFAYILAEKHELELPDFKDFHATQKFIEMHSGKKNPNRSNKISFFHAHVYHGKKSEFLKARIKDLECLFSMRKGEDCKREVGLFLYRLWMQELTGDATKALQKTLEFNSTLDVPLHNDYVVTRTYSAEKKLKTGESYLYSAKKIKEVLEITKEELQELHSLNGAERNKKEANRKAYLTRLKKDGKNTKEERVAERRKQITELLEQGLNRKEICTTLQISRATYQRDMAVIKMQISSSNADSEDKAEMEKQTEAKGTMRKTKSIKPNVPNVKPNAVKVSFIWEKNCIKNSVHLLKKALRRSAARKMRVAYGMYSMVSYDALHPP